MFFAKSQLVRNFRSAKIILNNFKKKNKKNLYYVLIYLKKKIKFKKKMKYLDQK